MSRDSKKVGKLVMLKSKAKKCRFEGVKLLIAAYEGGRPAATISRLSHIILIFSSEPP